MNCDPLTEDFKEKMQDVKLFDFYAAMAMQGLVHMDKGYEEIAEMSYLMANAMLEERKKYIK